MHNMDYKIVKKESFNIIGKSITTSAMSSEIPEFWSKCWADGTCAKLMELSKNKCPAGICYNFKEDSSMDYMIGLEYTDSNVSGFEILNIQESTYIVFESIGNSERIIADSWLYIMSDFFPKSELNYSQAPSIELYKKWDTEKKEFHIEIWIPLVS